MKNTFQKWRQYRRILGQLKSQLGYAVFACQWGRAFNLCDRMRRVKGLPPERSLARYQAGKLAWVQSHGVLPTWEFDKLSLS